MLEAGVAGGDRELAGTLEVAGVVAGPAGGQSSATRPAAISRRTMHDHGLEHQAVTRLKAEAADVQVAPLGLDVRQQRQAGVAIGRAVLEMGRD